MPETRLVMKVPEERYVNVRPRVFNLSLSGDWPFHQLCFLDN